MCIRSALMTLEVSADKLNKKKLNGAYIFFCNLRVIIAFG